MECYDELCISKRRGTFAIGRRCRVVHFGGDARVCTVWAGVSGTGGAGPMSAAGARHGGGGGRRGGGRGRGARLAAARLRSRTVPRAELPPRRRAARVPRRVPRLPVPCGARQVRPALLSRHKDLAP